MNDLFARIQTTRETIETTDKVLSAISLIRAYIQRGDLAAADRIAKDLEFDVAIVNGCARNEVESLEKEVVAFEAEMLHQHMSAFPEYQISYVVSAA